MLEIHQRNDINGYAEYLEKFQLSTDDVKIIEAFDKEDVIGFAIFTYSDDTLIIYTVSAANDLYLFDGLVRSALFKASMFGIEKAEIHTDNSAELEMYRKLKFITENDLTIPSISEFMNGCKNCKKFC